MQPTPDPALQDLVKRALDEGKFDLIQLWFDSSVLDRYRGDPDSRILRSNSAGRVKAPGGWMVNFGISGDDAFIHMPIRTFLGVAEGHRDHWLAKLVAPPASTNFLRMTLTPGACIDDGPSRDW